MFTEYKQQITWGNRLLTLETGKIARQAEGAVLATYGGTSVLCTVVAEKTVKPGIDFFPLTVVYQEKAFAVGKIPGGFFKREGRASEKENLVARLIDRPLRPLFHHRFRNETQIICTVLSYDLENNPDIVAMIGASAALTLSGIPFFGPLAGCRVGYKNGEFILNPVVSQMAETQLDLVLGGTAEGILMVESQAQELSEDIMLQAVEFGHKQYSPVIDCIINLAEKAAKEPWDIPDAPEIEQAIFTRLKDHFHQTLTTAYEEPNKTERYKKIKSIQNEALDLFADQGIEGHVILEQFEELKYQLVRHNLIATAKRIDGRNQTTIRPIVSQVGVLPRTHGSALFTRGETQALTVATLGTTQDEQIIDDLGGEYRERFLLHYNFPPYSVGEVGRMGGPGRREIGHGKLAWRAIFPVLPKKEDFPYTMRVVTEITESNGSSSMATVCGSSLALMDAGVPLKSPVAGIAMGLIKENDNFIILSDILGDEDALGDMDFKVAGTTDGITALQMDLKISSITADIMKQALQQAHQGRLHILKEMEKTLTTFRPTINEHAPRIETLKIPKEKIREVIGTGGKVIRELCETTNTKIDIAEDGTVQISGTDQQSIQQAVERIKGITSEPEVGQVYTGKVVKIMDFGAFVNFMGSRDGLVHISEIAATRINKVTDILAVGDAVQVKVLGLDDKGKIRLSIKATLACDRAE